MSCAAPLSKMIRKIKQKRCPKCNWWKELVDFHNNKKLKDGLSFYCKECTLKQRRVSYEKKKKPIRFLNRKQNVKGWTCNHCGIFKMPNLYHKNGKYPDGTQRHQCWCAECTKEANYKAKLKNGWLLLTKEQYNHLYNQQAGKCAICGTHQKELKRTLHTDHSHETGKIRGLLCFKCNAVLGMMNDSPERLNKAIQYLNRAKIKVYTA